MRSDALFVSPRNVGDVITFDEPLFDDSLYEGRTPVAEEGQTFTVASTLGNTIALLYRNEDNGWNSLVVYWPDDLINARWLGKNTPLEEDVAWDYYDG